jgi:hypothetical protein
MPRYNINADFALTTEIECDPGYHAFSTEGTEEFSDESYFSTQSIEADGGNLRFVIVADSEEQATEKACEVISDGMEVEDSNGLTWLVEQVNIDVEAIEEPMTALRAKALIEEYLSSMEGMDEDLKEAFSFLLDLLTTARI